MSMCQIAITVIETDDAGAERLIHSKILHTRIDPDVVKRAELLLYVDEAAAYVQARRGAAGDPLER